MGTRWIEEWQAEGPRSRIQVSGRSDEEAYHNAILVGERLWPGFEFVDLIEYNEGSFIGYYLGVPYDWDTLDPWLMRGGIHGP